MAGEVSEPPHFLDGSQGLAPREASSGGQPLLITAPLDFAATHRSPGSLPPDNRSVTGPRAAAGVPGLIPSAARFHSERCPVWFRVPPGLIPSAARFDVRRAHDLASCQSLGSREPAQIYINF